MPDGDADDTMNTAEALVMGHQRFASFSQFDSPVFLPPDPVWASDVREAARRQIREAANVETLLCGYIELLARSKALVDFWEANVGPTEDWPMTIAGESDEAEACLARKVEKLRVSVSLLDESLCG